MTEADGEEKRLVEDWEGRHEGGIAVGMPAGEGTRKRSQHSMHVNA